MTVLGQLTAGLSIKALAGTHGSAGDAVQAASS